MRNVVEWFFANAGKFLATAIPVWMVVMVILVIMFTMVFLRTMHRYHQDLVNTLERIMQNQTTSIRLLFQFIMDKREPETDFVLKRLDVLEKKAGIANGIPLLTNVERVELLNEIKHELAEMETPSKTTDEVKVVPEGK